MRIELLRFDIPDSEAERYLPLLLSGGKSAPALSPAAEPDPVFEPVDYEPDVLPGISAAPLPTAPAENFYAADTAEVAPTVSKPTGSLKRARSLVWDEKSGRFVRRSRFHWFIQQWTQLRATASQIAVSSSTLAILSGTLLGLAVLLVCIRFGLVGWLHASLADSGQHVEQVEPATEPATEEQAQEGVPIEPPAQRPGDASEKSGLHGEKPPMRKGVMEE